VPYDFLGSQPFNAIAGFLFFESEPQGNGYSCCECICWLTDAHCQPRDACHFVERAEWVLQVMKTIVDEAHIYRLITKRDSLYIGNERLDAQRVPACPLCNATNCAYRDIGRNHIGASFSNQLGVHPRSRTDYES
jgi:hypothetical protein